MRRFMPLLILALLGACGRSAAPAVTPTAYIARTPTPMIYRDCGWGGVAEVWVDDNENGVWDAGERPLAGVTITAQTIGSYSSARGTTNSAGRAGLDTGMRDCPVPEVRVYLGTPTGYRPTTPETLPGNGGTYRFGLVPTTPTAATATRTTVRTTASTTTSATASRIAGTPTARAWGPPAAALIYDGESRSAQRTSSTWTQDGRGIAADGAPRPWDMQTLPVPTGATLILTIEEGFSLNGIFVQPTPLTAQGYRVATPFAVQIPVRFSGTHAEIVVALTPGDYLLMVYAHFPQGSADYGFRIVLTP